MVISDYREDKDLVDRIACGDQRAFRELFDRLAGNVFRLSYSLLLDHQMAEDATQEVFVKLWKNAEDWRPEASIKTWLLTVAHNFCMDTLRKKKTDLKKQQGLYKEHLASGEESELRHAENRIDEKKHKKSITDAIFSLPQRQREAVMLVYYMEVHNSEAARIMSMKDSTFDSLLARARKNLRNRLDSERDDLKKCFIYGAE